MLAVLPLYDPLAGRGDAEYLRRVIEGLAARGVDLEVLTTSDTAVRDDTPEARLWPNALQRLLPHPAPVPVRRFHVANVPGWLRGYGTRLVQRARQRRLHTRGLGLGYSYLGAGFHPLEHWASGFPFRWTGADAHFHIDRPGGRDVVVELYAPGIATIDVLANGRMAKSIGLKSGAWQRVELPLPASGISSFELRVRPTFTPRGEKRRLGVAIRTVTVRTRTGDDLPIPLDRERDSLLQPLDTFLLAEQHEADGHEWGVVASTWDALLKGPVSLRMAWAAVRAARGCDLVLVAGTPYLTSVYGWLAARIARRPLVAIPFFRLRDREHHRPWQRWALRRADRLFVQGEAMARVVESRWHRPATVLPGSLDAAELDVAGVDDQRFRSRHGLDAGPLALMVAPKTGASGYRAFCAAAEELRRAQPTWQFALVGHDEDGLPMPGTAVRHLGPLRAEEAREALGACDVFVRPSSSETSLVPYLQAWTRGKPVIGHADAEPVREMVSAGEDGLLVKNDAELLAALRRLLEDPELRARLGGRGREKVTARFTWDHVASEIDELLYDMGVRREA